MSSSYRPKQEHTVPWFWPMAAAIEWGKQGLQMYRDNLLYLHEVHAMNHPLPPTWTTENTIDLELETLVLRNFSIDGASSDIPTLILTPYAGQSSTIADFAPGKSVVEVMKSHGLNRIYVSDWKPATLAMKDFGIDRYLEDIDRVVRHLGGRINLVGLCQGGWIGLIYGARYPETLHTLVLVGAPIDTDAGAGSIRDIARRLPMSFYEEMVKLGGGLISGKIMLAGWKNLKPQEQFFSKYLELYEHIEDKNYIERTKKFEEWYENVYDLPGAYYLETIQKIFKENRIVKGEFFALGANIDLKKICCPLYLMAGARDEITPASQVFATENYVSTPKTEIVKRLTPCGHLGLYMGSQAIREVWPEISEWIKDHAASVVTSP